jgi:GTP-binding protein Era
MTHCGFTAVIGAPNAGKSTLVNALVGTKVAIVSPKVQTTRMNVRGIVMRGDAQIVFVDTPGIFRPRRRLDRAMVGAAWSGAGEADAILLLVDAADITANASSPAARDTDAILQGLKDGKRKKTAPERRAGEQGEPSPARPSNESGQSQRSKIALVLNKIDGMKRTDLLPLVEKFRAEGLFEDIFLVSALKGDGLDALLDWVKARMPEGPWHYPEDEAADVPARLLASEVTREKIYLRLHDELPYATTVETEKWEERRDGSVKIDQTIYVQRDGQKAIVLGKGGATIKKIGELARTELEEMFGRKVHLFLFVKVREDWDQQREHYKEMGLEFPPDE